MRAGLARRALVPLVRRVCQGAFVVAAHAGACALRRRRGASAGEPDSHDARWCPSCGAYARVRSSWLRTLAHVPYGDDAVHLLVRVRRYEFVTCSRSWSDDLEAVGAGRGVLSVPAVMWALRRV